MQVSGRTRVLVHLSYPSAHLRTPQIFNARCEERRVDAILVPWQVQPTNLQAVMDALRVSESVAGAIITIPHKEAAALLCDRLEGPAELLKVANVVRRLDDGTLVGRILDGDGFVGGLIRSGHSVQGKRVLVVGAGGVGVAIVDALLTAGVAGLTISNRTQARAVSVVDKLKTIHPGAAIDVGPADGAGHDLIVNATALGMHEGDPLPVDPATIAPGTVAAEVVMAPPVTAFLEAARERGAVIHEGVHMLTGQIDPFIDFVVDPQNCDSVNHTEREQE